MFLAEFILYAEIQILKWFSATCRQRVLFEEFVIKISDIINCLIYYTDLFV